MPNTVPPTASAVLAEKHAIAAAAAHIAFGLYGLLGEDTIDRVDELVAGGVIGFKLYMGNTFGAIPSPDTGAMLECLEAVAPTGKRVSLHAEENTIMVRRETRMRQAGRTDPLAHLAARPAIVATKAVSRAAALAEWTGAPACAAHLVGRRTSPAGRGRRAGWTSPARPARNICSRPPTTTPDGRASSA